MTVVHTETVYQIAEILAVATSLTALASPSFAFTAEAQRQCTGGAFRLCSPEIPDIGRITVCMVKTAPASARAVASSSTRGSLQDLTGAPRSEPPDSADAICC